ncbi:MAG: nuclear transport factor 2 family protein [Chitinophagaceae bacterium]|nr:nuclear transport factor 2 family protein [Chitinophagaceae bacterium]
MKTAFLTLLSIALLSETASSQTAEERRLDSMKKVLQQRYEELAVKFDLRNLDTMLSFRTKDFRIIGQNGEMQDYPMSVENTKYFITNNIPPYHIKNTIQKIRISPNNLIAVVDVQQESVRKRELAGKLRDVKVMVDQTETWVYQDGKWLAQIVENIHNRKRYVDGKRVSDDPNAPYDPNAPEYVDPTEQVSQNKAASVNDSRGKQLTGKDAATAKLLQSQFDTMAAAFMRDDMLTVSRFYTDDAIIAGGKTEISGRKAIDKYWLSLKGKAKDWKLITNSVEVKNNIAFHDGISVVTIVQSGKESQSKSRFLVVWEKQKSGSWKITKDYYAPYF